MTSSSRSICLLRATPRCARALFGLTFSASAKKTAASA